MAYRLKLPPESAIHRIFLISQLRKAVGIIQTISHILEHLAVESQPMIEPEAILQVRASSAGGSDLEVLIQWKNSPDFEATWESVESIRQQFPNFHLEDRMDLRGVSDGKPPAIITYTRRKKQPSQMPSQLSNINQFLLQVICYFVSCWEVVS